MKQSNILKMLALMMIAGLFLCACGKKGPPIPQDQRSMFSWQETSADLSGDCMVITGTLDGAYENVDSFALELEPVIDGICLDCPFKPSEFPELTPTAGREGTFTFQYCPTNRADAYRWRMVARNIYQALPHALGPINLLRRPF